MGRLSGEGGGSGGAILTGSLCVTFNSLALSSGIACFSFY